MLANVVLVGYERHWMSVPQPDTPEAPKTKAWLSEEEEDMQY